MEKCTTGETEITGHGQRDELIGDEQDFVSSPLWRRSFERVVRDETRPTVGQHDGKMVFVSRVV